MVAGEGDFNALGVFLECEALEVRLKSLTDDWRGRDRELVEGFSSLGVEGVERRHEDQGLKSKSGSERRM